MVKLPLKYRSKKGAVKPRTRVINTLITICYITIDCGVADKVGIEWYKMGSSGWIIRQFAREQYKHFLELNFLEDPNARDIFSGSLDANTIITALTAYTRASLVPHETLVFFDEIQECPQARTAIKFLVEDGRFDYIESGSLLGVRSGEATSYPVGYEKLLQMFPLDLEEFSWATGIQPEVLDHVRTAFENRTPVHPAIHARMSRIFRLYAIVGVCQRQYRNMLTHTICAGC